MPAARIPRRETAREHVGNALALLVAQQALDADLVRPDGYGNVEVPLAALAAIRERLTVALAELDHERQELLERDRELLAALVDVHRGTFDTLSRQRIELGLAELGLTVEAAEVLLGRIPGRSPRTPASSREAHGMRTVTTGRSLKIWRRQQGWSQTTASNWAGIDVRSWQRYEAGDSPEGGILPLWLTRRIQEHMLMREHVERLRPDLRFDPATYTFVEKRKAP